MEQKIELVIITGFLGAGKTTLLNKIITSYGDRKIGLLINDFGKVPVDGSLIRKSHTDLEESRIYEIGNGSIFCSCLTSSFILGLKYFMEQKPDILFIETSGMSDPGSMARLLEEYQLRGAFAIRHVLAVVDSTNFLKMRANLTFVDRQIRASNTVLLNKADLIDDSLKEEIEKTVKEINSFAFIRRTTFCDYDYSLLKEEAFLPGRSLPSCNTPSSAPGKMFLEQSDIPAEPFRKFLSEIAGYTLRLKGYYELDGVVSYFTNNNGSVESSEKDDSFRGEKGITLIYEKKNEPVIKEKWAALKP
ncbi:MAG: GTP-binding protein [Spirochaetales bacterium]|nr:GTP-binding protein [Spirochaetales bacterium]